MGKTSNGTKGYICEPPKEEKVSPSGFQYNKKHHSLLVTPCRSTMDGQVLSDLNLIKTAEIFKDCLMLEVKYRCLTHHKHQHFAHVTKSSDCSCTSSRVTLYVPLWDNSHWCQALLACEFGLTLTALH